MGREEQERVRESLHKLLRSTFRAPAVLGLRRQDAGANGEAGPKGEPRMRRVILTYSGSCAPAAHELSSLATLVQRFLRTSLLFERETP
jgi:hypothetical protein